MNRQTLFHLVAHGDGSTTEFKGTIPTDLEIVGVADHKRR